MVWGLAAHCIGLPKARKCNIVPQGALFRDSIWIVCCENDGLHQSQRREDAKYFDQLYLEVEEVFNRDSKLQKRIIFVEHIFSRPVIFRRAEFWFLLGFWAEYIWYRLLCLRFLLDVGLVQRIYQVAVFPAFGVLLDNVPGCYLVELKLCFLGFWTLSGS